MRERLYKRKSVWWCRVRNKAGRVVRKSTHCRDYHAALVAAAELERSAASTSHAAAEATALRGCVNDYLADLVRRGRSAATIAIAQQKTGHLLRLWGPRYPMGRITARVVTEYVDKRLGEGVTRFTVKKELGHLGQVLRIARHHGVFHLDVEQVLPPFFAGGHKPRTRWPTPAELDAILAELEPRRAAHLAFIVATGARRGEAARARRRDVDWTRRVVHIRGTKTERADDDVPITTVAENYLRASLAAAPGNDLLFHPWGMLNRDVAAACVRAGVPKVSPNDLRRAFGKWHRAAGVPVELVARMLRHTTDKLAQTTYATLDGVQLSALVGQHLQTATVRVSGLYREGASDSTKQLPAHDEGEGPPVENKENSGAPGRTRNGALRFRKPIDERRSRGTKLGLARASARGSVSDLYPGVCVVFAPGRTFVIDRGVVRQITGGGAS